MCGFFIIISVWVRHGFSKKDFFNFQNIFLSMQKKKLRKKLDHYFDVELCEESIFGIKKMYFNYSNIKYIKKEKCLDIEPIS